MDSRDDGRVIILGPDIHIGAILEQQIHDVGIIETRGIMQRCPSFVVLPIYVRTVHAQVLAYVVTAVAGCKDQTRG